MTKEEKLYEEIGTSIEGAVQSQMFGKPCFKVNGKAFISFFENCMVFKLTGSFHTEALLLKDAKLFDPSGKGRAMKEWIQLPGKHSSRWSELATAAFEYVQANS